MTAAKCAISEKLLQDAAPRNDRYGGKLLKVLPLLIGLLCLAFKFQEQQPATDLAAQIMKPTKVVPPTWNWLPTHRTRTQPVQTQARHFTRTLAHHAHASSSGKPGEHVMAVAEQTKPGVDALPTTSTAFEAWQDLLNDAKEMKSTHLRTLLQDQSRNDALFVKSTDGVVLDLSHEKVTTTTMRKLIELAELMGFEKKRHDMYSGRKINAVEGRAVLHTALRAQRESLIEVDGRNVVPDVWAVLDSIKAFTNKVRSGEFVGHTGKKLVDVVAIGIGGSYLGTEFVYEALRTDPEGANAASGRRLRLLANVDPIDVRRALDGLSAETTLVVVVSKTFTTAETILNAKTLRQWLVDELGSSADLSKHIVAVSSATDKAQEFGINPANVFPFWDWVGGRFSVCSAVGVLPLSLQYGFEIVENFLEGARAMDKHFLTAKPEENIPLLVGLVAVWNLNFLDFGAYAILPYCQALVRFVAHVQQLDMESNGKRVQMDGTEAYGTTGAIYFGEPGTNGQHSFYQLMHQGRVIPAEFIGFSRSQNPVELPDEELSNHDVLMANFFAQPEALALGQTLDEVKAGGVPDDLAPHKTFPGDRPSLSLLFPVPNAYWLGQLLALYEHRAAVQGWLWNINSFDQFGVELGKGLGTDLFKYLSMARKGGDEECVLGDQQISCTQKKLLSEYLTPSDTP